MSRIRYTAYENFAHDTPETVGVLLANLGTPEAPTTGAVRRYLAQFLWDPRVLEAPRWLWWLILHGIILRFRPRRSAKAYATVWTDEGSPLLVFARRQARALQAHVDRHRSDWPCDVHVALGMSYGKPAIADAMRELRSRGATRIAVLPLYPQYSGTTTGSVFDAVAKELKVWRRVPDLRFLAHYHDRREYIDALAASLAPRLNSGSWDRLLFSFHGLPQRYLEAGDPYHCECYKTARLVAERLDLPDEKWAVSFQSRVGKEPWLKPYTDETLRSWAREGVSKVLVACPGFSADCLETLEEVAVEYGKLFVSEGGESLEYIPALNDRPEHIGALYSMLLDETTSWRDTDAGPEHTDEAYAGRRERALALGASV